MAMKHLFASGLRAIAILALALPAIACAAENGAAARYAGDPYMGPVSVRVRAPDGTLKKTDAGTASAHFEKLRDGRTRLVVDGLINKETASFIVDGSDSASGWRANESGVTMNLTPGGSLRGSGDAATQRFDFNGAVTDAHFGLDVELEVLQSKRGGPPPGTTFLFHYDLDRVAGAARTASLRPSAAGIAASSGKRTTSGRSAAESNRRCKRTVWQTRNVASLSSAPMIMTRVPVCVQW